MKHERLLRHAKELLEAGLYFRAVRNLKTPERRLAGILKTRVAFEEHLKDLIKRTNATPEIDFSLQSRQTVAKVAISGVTLDPDYVPDEPVLAAFRASNLDPNDPLHWRLLLTALCWSHFPPERRPGRPSWSNEQYGQLLADRAQLIAEAGRTLSDRKIAEELTTNKKFRKRYKKFERVRQALREARHPDHHTALKVHLYTELSAALAAGNLPSSEKERDARREELIGLHCDRIAQLWAQNGSDDAR